MSEAERELKVKRKAIPLRRGLSELRSSQKSLPAFQASHGDSLPRVLLPSAFGEAHGFLSATKINRAPLFLQRGSEASPMLHPSVISLLITALLDSGREGTNAEQPWTRARGRI